ncbi:hypothetical protein BBO01nite_42800 [Brevibacillus borstelensis]|nr:hypothetical protein BBO01nite_42800 [Brevibacillus borstelensis]
MEECYENSQATDYAFEVMFYFLVQQRRTRLQDPSYDKLKILYIHSIFNRKEDHDGYSTCERFYF